MKTKKLKATKIIIPDHTCPYVDKLQDKIESALDSCEQALIWIGNDERMYKKDKKPIVSKLKLLLKQLEKISDDVEAVRDANDRLREVLYILDGSIADIITSLPTGDE